MAGYRQTNPDRAKAAAATLAVHIAIGAALLTGLVTQAVRHPSDVLQTFDVVPPPPPIVEVATKEAAKGNPGEAGKKAEPTPVVVPKPKIEVPVKPTVAAAPIAGRGAAPSAGAAQAGSGTGAGGSGTGLGGGGSGGGGAGRTPATLISGRLSRGDARQFAASGLPAGQADLDLIVSPEGRVQNCQILRSSGVVEVDRSLCAIAGQRFRFRPAREADGTPIRYRVNYHATWR